MNYQYIDFDLLFFFLIFRFLFDDHTPIGYAVAYLMVSGTLYVILYMVTSALGMIVVVFGIASTVVKDMRVQLHGFDGICEDQAKIIEWSCAFYYAYSSVIKCVIS